MAKEKEISIKEARNFLKARRDFTYLDSDFVKLLNKNKKVKGNENDNHRKKRFDPQND
jgi:hypothetical protein